MRRVLVLALLGGFAVATSGCAEVYHGYFGYGDKTEAQPPIPFDGGEVTTTLDIRVNQYSGNEIGAKVLYGVRNTSREDRCVIVGFSSQDVSKYGVPARLAVFVRRGQRQPLQIDLWAHEEANQITWPNPWARSLVSTAEACV